MFNISPLLVTQVYEWQQFEQHNAVPHDLLHVPNYHKAKDHEHS